MFSRSSNILIVCIMLIALGGVLQATAAEIPDPEVLLAAYQAGNDALNAHDVDMLLSGWTDDAVFDYVPFPPPLNGKEEIAEFFTGIFQTFPDVHVTDTSPPLISGNIVVTQHLGTGTHLGELNGIPATGNSIQSMHLDIVEYEGDKVKRVTTYEDYTTWLVQLGIMPAPEPLELVPSFTLPEPEPTGLAPLEAAAEYNARWNSHDLVSLAKIIHPDAEILAPAFGGPMNRDAHIALAELEFTGFSDLHGEIVRSIDMGDGWVVVELVFTGTNDGPYLGIPATGRSGTVRAGALQRFDADGLLTNTSSYFDNITVLTQLGLFPPLPPLPEYPPIPDYLVQDQITSPSLEGNPLGDPATRDVLVYLPPSYETSPDKHYPTVYLLHGYTGDHRFFVFVVNVNVQSLTGIDLGVDIGDIVNSLMQAGEMGEVIIVMPDAKNAYGGSMYERSEVIGDYRKFIASELVSYIDGKYRTIADREHRAITGHSMGGYGALSLAIEYPDVFGAVAALSPGLSDMEAKPTMIDSFIAENPNTLGVPIIVSTDDDMWKLFLTKFWTNAFYSLAAAYSPNLDNPPYYVDLPVKYPDKTLVDEVWEKWQDRDLVSQIERDGANLSNTPIFIDRGVGETVIMAEVPGIDRLPAALDAQGIPYTYDEFDGDHGTHARYQLESALKFLYPHIAPPVDTEANKEILRRYLEEFWNKGNMDVADEIIDPEYIHYTAGVPDVIGLEATKQTVAGFRTAFPDLQWTVDDIFAEGDKVVVRETFRGTQEGEWEFMGIPPTGKQITFTGIAICRVAGGKLVEARGNYDFLGMMQQLGVIPPDREDFTWGEPSEVTGEPGDPETNKTLAHRHFEEIWNQGNLDAIDEALIAESILHDPTNPEGVVPGIEPYKQYVTMYRTAFPDLHITVEDAIAEGDKVAVRWTARGTQTGDLPGIPATGKQVTMTGISIDRFADGKTVEGWVSSDTLGMLQQLGVIPPPGPPEGYDNVFFMSLQSGLNMVSLPLKPITPYTARSFAEELFATVVIKLDEARQRFVGFTLDAPDDGFAIEGGKGYIVNVPEAKVVAFTGAAWTNQPPVEAAPEVRFAKQSRESGDFGYPAQNDGAWAFVVSGRLQVEDPDFIGDDSMDILKKDGYLVTLRNTRTNTVATDVVRSRYFAAAFADLNRRNVVQTGDRLELQVRNQAGEIVSNTLSYTVTAEAIRQAFLPITLKNVEIPRQSLLLQNYPNPFNPETWIPYQIREPALVVLRIYNAKGQLVRTLDLGQRAAGFYLGHTRAAYWDGHNDVGEKVTSGIYFYQIQAGDFSATRKLVIVK